MERSSSSHGSGGGYGGEEQHPLRGVETARSLAAGRVVELEHEAKRGRTRRASVRAALVVCLLTLIPAVLFLQRWQASSSSDGLFEAELPSEDDEQGMHAPNDPTQQPYPLHASYL
ncbi:hypothetical protein ABZP36_023469 [Zizania latifolia]